MQEHRIPSGDVVLAAREYGEPTTAAEGPHVVLLHGWPDDQSVWDGVVAGLPDLHLVTYDVRGAGRSTAPASTRDYAMTDLADDLVAVVDALVPTGQRFHLVGHDWGSIQAWSHLADARLRNRVASFVSISGPSLDQVGAQLRRPRGRVRPALVQLAHSYYVFLFQLPVIPALLLRRRNPMTRFAMRQLAANGRAAQWTPDFGETAANGTHIYRRNILPRLLRPRPTRVHVPVLLVVLRDDEAVTQVLLQDTERYCDSIRRVELDGAHWTVTERPKDISRVVHEHLERVRRTGLP